MTSNIFAVDKNVTHNLLEEFGRTEKTANEDVFAIKKWLTTQHHLPEIMGDFKIRNILLLCKFNIEKAKQKIDMYYTIRTRFPGWFKNNPKSPLMQHYRKTMYTCFLPKPINERYRVIFLKPTVPNAYDPVGQINLILNIGETFFDEEHLLIDFIAIFDMANLTVNDFRKVTPMFLSQMYFTYQRVYTARIKAIYIINAPSYICTTLSITKMVFPPKLFAKIHVNEDAGVLNEIFSKEQLPKDYGGDGESLKELNDIMWLRISEYQNRFDLLDKLKVNEDLRPKQLKNDEMLGFYGSFRKLDID